MKNNNKRMILISLTLGLLITLANVGLSSILVRSAMAYDGNDFVAYLDQNTATSNGLFEIVDVATSNGLSEIVKVATSNGLFETVDLTTSNGLLETIDRATDNGISAVSLISVPNYLDFGSHSIGVRPQAIRLGDAGVRTSVDDAVIVVSNPYAATNWSIWATPQPSGDGVSSDLADMLRIGSTGALGVANSVFNFSGESTYEEITITWQTLMENERDIQVFVPPGAVTPESYSAEIVWSIVPM